MKPKHQRLIFVAVTVVFLCISALLAMRAFRDNIVFFYTPSELSAHSIAPGQIIRVGGLVESGSIVRDGDDRITFTMTDGTSRLFVSYQGMLPALFRDGQGAVAEGRLSGERFDASRILTKHDERYMPREVMDALKKSGRWQEGK